MAEETTNQTAETTTTKPEETAKKKYNYNGVELDKDLLVTNLNHNAQNYVEHMQRYNGWDESKSREFYDALDNFMSALDADRLSTDRSGRIIDTQGELNNGTANYRDKTGKVLTQEEYDALKDKDKKKVTNDFFANREVASYMNTIAKGLYDRQMANPKKAEKFDLTKHGLWEKFTAKVAPDKEGDLDAWLDLDPYDEKTKKRGITNRANYLADYLEKNYLKKLNKDLDFSDSGNWENYDEYVADIKDLITDLRNGIIDSSDFRKLSALGAPSAAYRAYFTTDKDYKEPSPEDEEAEKNAARIKGLNDLVQQKRNKYNSVEHKSYWISEEKGGPKGVEVDTTAEDKITAYKNALNKANKDMDFWSSDKLRTTTGKEYANYIEQYAQYNPDAFEDAGYGSKYSGWRYMPGSINQDDMSVLGYNPENHKVMRLSLYDLGSAARQIYKEMIESMYGDNVENDSGLLFKKEGGVLFQQEGGGMASYQKSLDAINSFSNGLGEQSKKTKSDPKLRQPGAEENAYSSNEFTATDKARLASVAADIAALIDPEPISALSLGVASDVTNLVSDFKEGYGFWNSMGNFAANLGLSAVGMIPIFGDAVGSGTKVVKTLVKLVPKVSKALMASGAIYAVTNSDELLKSLSKIGKDGPENQMNVEDWRNIGTIIQLVLGGANAVKNAKTTKKLNTASKSHAAKVELQDATTGERKTMIFGNKEVSAKLKAAKTPEEVNDIIHQYNSLKNYNVATKDVKTSVWFTKNPNFKKLKPWTWRGKQTSQVAVKDYVTEARDLAGIQRAYNSGEFNTGPLGGLLSRSRYIAKHSTNYPGYDMERMPTTIWGKPAKPKAASKKATKASGTQEKAATATQENTKQNTTSAAENTTPQATSAQNSAAAPAKSKLKSYDKMSTAERKKTIAGARAHFKKYQDALGKRGKKPPHSPEGQAMLDSGVANEYNLYTRGMWRQGGSFARIRKIYKGQNNLKVTNFPGFMNLNGIDYPNQYLYDNGIIDESGNLSNMRIDDMNKILSTYTGGGSSSSNPIQFNNGELATITGTSSYNNAGKKKVNNVTLNNSPNYSSDLRFGLTLTPGKFFGTGFNKLAEGYLNGEYNATGKVSGSGIYNHNVDENLRMNEGLTTPKIGSVYTGSSEQTDYNDLQRNTTLTRNWIFGDNNDVRANDFITWAKQWLQEHPEGTQDQMLKAYNDIVNELYSYKHEMGQRSGENSYREDDVVRNFNQKHRSIYSTANDENHLGYSVKLENINGTTTAQRPIDITDNDITNIDWNSYLTGPGNERLAELLKGVSKDASGLYYVNTEPDFSYQPEPETAASTPEPNTSENVASSANSFVDEALRTQNNTKQKQPSNILGLLSDVTPDLLGAGRFLASLGIGKAMLKNARNMPVNLYSPTGMLKWREGNYGAIQRGYAQKGELNHLASLATGSDAAQARALQQEANQNGEKYVAQGYLTNDTAEANSRNAAWTQELQNQESRYNTAMTNRGNLFNHRVGYLQALDNYKRAQFESINNLLGEYEGRARANQERNRTYRDAYAEATLKNEISANPEKYGITLTADEKQILDDVLSGKKDLSTLSDADTAAFTRASNAIDEVVAMRTAAAKGFKYLPYTWFKSGRLNGNPFVMDFTEVPTTTGSKKQGGKIGTDSEKITIQKLRGRLQRMQVFQRHLESRMNAFERDLDRAQRSASQYVQGQTKR